LTLFLAYFPSTNPTILLLNGPLAHRILIAYFCSIAHSMLIFLAAIRAPNRSCRPPASLRSMRDLKNSKEGLING
jgi:hypothetical protein